MGAVLREHVRIVIGVVIREGDLGVIVHIVHRRLRVEDGACRHPVRHVLLAPCWVLRHGDKRLVRVIQTCIQNSDHHALALVVNAGGIVNARRVDVRVVADRNGRHGVGLGEIHARHAVHVLQRLVPLGVDPQGKPVVDSRIGILFLISDAGGIQPRQEGFLRRLQLFPRRLSLGRFAVLGEAVRRGVLIERVERVASQLHDNPPLAREVGTVRFCQRGKILPAQRLGVQPVHAGQRPLPVTGQGRRPRTGQNTAGDCRQGQTLQ